MSLGFKNRVIQCAVGIFLIIPTIVLPVARGADVKESDSGVAFEQGGQADARRLSWTRIVEMFNKYLANAKQVNVFAGICRSGGMIDASAGLTMPNVISTAAKV